MDKDKLNILHLDDEADHRLIMQRLLESTNLDYQLVQCASVDAMKDALAHQAFDICLMDFSLGRVTARDLLGLFDGVPVVVVTVMEDEELDSELMRIGAADFVSKSELSPSLLKRVIRHAIERQTILNQLKDESLHDALTGVYNRRFGLREIRRLAADYRRHGHPYALCLLDMDNLKAINDDFGHLAGDAAIRGFAEAMNSLVREADAVVRLGGDEFLVLLPNSGREQAEAMVERLRTRLVQAPLRWQEHAFHVAASAGIVEGSGLAPEAELELADKHMYANKRRRKSC